MIDKLIAYIQLHITSLEQDIEELEAEVDFENPLNMEFDDLEIEIVSLNGQIQACNHILEYIKGE
jgi:hypothetical protein